jgi:hypothetical protein
VRVIIPLLVLTAVICAMPAVAQTFKPSANPVSDALREAVSRDSKNLVASAELMPAEKYEFHPTPEQMTFGQLVVHVVQTNIAICSAISGTPAPLTGEQLGKMSPTEPKDSLVGALKRSFDFCSDGLAKVTDAQMAEEVAMFGRATGMSRARAMVTIATDWADHYSTAAGYLRLNGILPPTAKPRK